MPAVFRCQLVALEWSLTDEHIARLDAVSPIELGFPTDMLSSELVSGLIHGETKGRLRR